MLIRIMCSSDEAFALGEETHLLSGLINEITTSDLLVRLNAIEMLSQVS